MTEPYEPAPETAFATPVQVTVRTFMQRLADGAFIDAFSMLGDTAPYTVIGTTRASRTYHGRVDVLENLVPVLSTFRVAPSLSFEEPVISGDRAVILGGGRGIGPTGPYDQPHYAFVTRVGDGEFLSIKEFMDTAMLETAVFGMTITKRGDLL